MTLQHGEQRPVLVEVEGSETRIHIRESLALKLGDRTFVLVPGDTVVLRRPETDGPWPEESP